MTNFNGFSNEDIGIYGRLKIPNTYWDKKTLVYKYWFRSLLQKIDSSLIFKNFPRNWSNDFFMFCLWSRGFVAVFDTNRADLEQYGEQIDGKTVLFQPCCASGIDFYYQPTKVQIANPKYENTLEIGKDCELIKLTPDCFFNGGVFDIIDYYASKLAELSKGIDMSIINSKTSIILTANSVGQNQTLKKVYDKIQAGETIVIYDDVQTNDEIIPRSEPFESWFNDFSKTFILDKQLTCFQTLLNSYYSEIGLPVANEKKERLITSETEFANAQSQARISCWVETLKESLEKVNEHFGLEIGVEYALQNDDNSGRNGIEQER